MKSQQKSVVSSWSQLFGFFIIALVISTSTCRFNQVKAQDDDGIIVKTNWCNREYYEATYGADWHIYWAAHFCWLYTGEEAPAMAPAPGQPALERKPKQPRPIRFAIRGR